MGTKVFQAPLNFKAEGQQGEFEAVFATLNVIDHDGDVTLPGAFGEQKVLIEPWNHNYQAPPVGKGMISERENEAIVLGKFFLDTPAGDEHYKVARQLAEMQEFSYTFQIIDAEPGMFEGQRVQFLKRLEVVGVGQVTRGAGIATRLTNIKSEITGDGQTDPDVSSADGDPSAADINTKINLAQLESIIRKLEI